MDNTSSLMISSAGEHHEFRTAEVNLDSYWRAISISIRERQSSEIVIKATIGAGIGYIALDDIDIQDWHCEGKCSYRSGYF